MKPIYRPTSRPIFKISIKFKTFIVWGKTRITMSLQVARGMPILIQCHLHRITFQQVKYSFQYCISLKNSKIPWLTGRATGRTQVWKGVTCFMSSGGWLQTPKNSWNLLYGDFKSGLSRGGDGKGSFLSSCLWQWLLQLAKGTETEQN